MTTFVYCDGIFLPNTQVWRNTTEEVLPTCDELSHISVPISEVKRACVVLPTLHFSVFGVLRCTVLPTANTSVVYERW
jgi:hypothetical protein